MKTLSPRISNRIFDLLVSFCSAHEGSRDSFVAAQDHGCVEFRFGGLLGFGGKFWNDAGKWYVTAYQEDTTPERETIIKSVNAALERLRTDLLLLEEAADLLETWQEHHGFKTNDAGTTDSTQLICNNPKECGCEYARTYRWLTEWKSRSEE